MAASRIFAQLARRGGARLIDKAIDTLLPGDRARLQARTAKLGEGATELPSAKKTLFGAIAGTLALRLATRSIPGAIAVGGAMLAKRRYDKRHAHSDNAKVAGKPGRKA